LRCAGLGKYASSYMYCLLVALHVCTRYVLAVHRGSCVPVCTSSFCTFCTIILHPALGSWLQRLSVANVSSQWSHTLGCLGWAVHSGGVFGRIRKVRALEPGCRMMTLWPTRLVLQVCWQPRVGIEVRQVQVWFQNRRQKERKLSNQASYGMDGRLNSAKCSHVDAEWCGLLARPPPPIARPRHAPP
jgi:hypothetical protein